MELSHKLFLSFLVCVSLLQANATLVEDKQALLDFVTQFPHSRDLNWDQYSPVCDHWTGVTCSGDGSRVIAVRLPGVGFHGPIPANTLGRLSALQILSLRSNGITDPFPSDLYNLSSLSFLYLQFNKFSGPLPYNFSAWKNLTIVNLSNNGFHGRIPDSISNLTYLAALNLANNSISGTIPDMHLPNLQQINLSNNNLTGIVPKSLEKFPNSVFSGNNVSLPNFVSPVLSLSPKPKPKLKSKLSQTAILGVVVTGCVVGFTEGVCLPRYWGRGRFGTTFKAILEDANTVVVKRLKEVGAGKREFEQQMEAFGSIKDENVCEPRAYYYSKDEKLLVYDYYSQGSVAAMLHGKRGEDITPLDWETRLRIAIGAARGIARIHAENTGKLVHGNVKSSNIFLNSRGYGCVSDHGLSTIMGPLAPLISRAAGYRAPEVTDTRKASQPSDVYSYGVLLLELLTGKSPVHTTSGDEIVHLVRWVHSVVREEWTAEVFDVELLRYSNIDEEMVEMLQIGLACVVRMPEQRPKMPDVVRMIESVRQSDYEKQPSSGAKSDNSTTPQHVSGFKPSTPQ
ncbi:leucine-rich repeat protein kinase family protein [Actinidia rufa]|uniref:Leucine-rich repeat protein kinase family protein n=1 Tax=Actinidia rufa TaxID=165716 RepID=A0A7J0FS94_9ERIC|nr:leucine-rich repeat protein kinase family protein [Actinidia rufa]